MPQGDISKTAKFSTQKWLQSSPTIKLSALYQKINATGSTIYVENFILNCIKNSTRLVLCRSTKMKLSSCTTVLFRKSDCSISVS